MFFDKSVYESVYTFCVFLTKLYTLLCIFDKKCIHFLCIFYKSVYISYVVLINVYTISVKIHILVWTCIKKALHVQLTFQSKYIYQCPKNATAKQQ